MAQFANLRVGKADVRPDASSHTPGVHEGNAAGASSSLATTETAPPDRSTGINPNNRRPITPGAPNLPPA